MQTQITVSNNLRELVNTNAIVRETINTPPWHMGWFIASGLSSHQTGAALDVSLGRVRDYEFRLAGDFVFMDITNHVIHFMPSEMHELSPQAVVFARAISINSADSIRGVPHAETFTSGALALQGYFVDVGFLPLASEWWHFDDPEAMRVARSLGIRGEFFIDTAYSTAP
jgi:D-alanyl-D-alanine dipeptidase